jgi:predicted O-methyltransferase YrrM
MNPFRALKKIWKNTDASKQCLNEIREVVANHSDLTNHKLNECIGLNRQIVTLLSKLVREGDPNAKEILDFQQPPFRAIEAPKSTSSAKEAIAQLPLMLADKTYNTAHPEYDARLVRNFPGLIFNGEHRSQNIVYKTLKPMMRKKKGVAEIKDNSWQTVLDKMMEEIKEIEGSSQVFERKIFIESYMLELSKRYSAHYIAGWVNLEDAIFLYWLVRCLKPKTIVQTGVCNGLSTAFMMLGLAKNGPEGRLYVIDLPAIFDPKDPAWTVKDKIYGVVIPEGKSSGWMVPDLYRDRLEVLCGDAKEFLPPLVDRLDSIDLFYHDSDHTYHHMMFEFAEVKRKLTAGGLIVADDISWNASLWDFADQYHAPAYNYKGAVGAAFF